MKLQVNEKIIKVYHHHSIFFFWRSLKVWSASLPFFLVLYILGPSIPNSVNIVAFFTILMAFALINVYDFTMYYLDTLVITNQRIVHLDWINPFKYLETQASLNDIQNIESEENGFLSKVPWLDFGMFLVETASTRTVISFTEAPDPEGIKFFVTNMSRKHLNVEGRAVGDNKIGTFTLNNKTENKISKVVR